MDSQPHHSDTEIGPYICRRCSALLEAGRGSFYVVEVKGYAENTPPVITAEDLAKDHATEMANLAAQMQTMSEQEIMDQVYRQMTFYLCGPCYRQWIENPTG